MAKPAEAGTKLENILCETVQLSDLALRVTSWLRSCSRHCERTRLSTGYFYMPEKRGTAVPFTNLTGFGKIETLGRALSLRGYSGTTHDVFDQG